jgi:hypothetical protein
MVSQLTSRLGIWYGPFAHCDCHRLTFKYSWGHSNNALERLSGSGFWLVVLEERIGKRNDRSFLGRFIDPRHHTVVILNLMVILSISVCDQ